MHAGNGLHPVIREMTLDDLDEVFDLGRNAPEFAVSNESSFWTKEELERWIAENTDDVLLVSELKGQVIGFVLAKYHNDDRA